MEAVRVAAVFIGHWSLVIKFRGRLTVGYLTLNQRIVGRNHAPEPFIKQAQSVMKQTKSARWRNRERARLTPGSRGSITFTGQPSFTNCLQALIVKQPVLTRKNGGAIPRQATISSLAASKHGRGQFFEGEGSKAPGVDSPPRRGSIFKFFRGSEPGVTS